MLGRKLGIEHCKECGCPIKKKIFTQKPNDTCPLGKWRPVEEEFRKTIRKSKKYRTI
jgi:hypothetical protein